MQIQDQLSNQIDISSAKELEEKMVRMQQPLHEWKEVHTPVPI